jgi:hypothetical protein
LLLITLTYREHEHGRVQNFQQGIVLLAYAYIIQLLNPKTKVMKTQMPVLSLRKSLMSLLLILTIAISCQDEDQGVKNNTDANAIPETIELEDYYLVEGDILIPKSFAGENGRTEQASTYNLVSYSSQPTIRVHILNTSSNFLPAAWYTEIVNATNDWTNITNCRISFSYVTSSNNADIIIQNDGGMLPPNVIAGATPPQGGNAGAIINVNPDFNNGSISAGQMRYNLVHELGHCIGFRHTNWSQRGEQADPDGANTVPGTPTSDPNSVMNGGTANFSWNGFSSNDILAAQTLYPQNNLISNGLISPNGGESFHGRTQGGGSAIFQMQIVLNTAVFNPTQVAVDLFQNDRAYYYGVHNVVNGTVSFVSAFPGAGLNVYKIKVTDVNNPNSYDISDNNFQITGH